MLIRVADPDLARVQRRAFCHFTNTIERAHELPTPEVGAISVIGTTYEHWDGTGWSPFPPVGAWTALPLATNWTDFAGGFAAAAYRKVGDVVTVRGTVKNAVNNNANPIATLPAGFRPGGGSEYFSSWAQWNNNAGRAAVRLDVLAGGNILINASFGFDNGRAPAVVTYDHVGLGVLRFSTA